MNGVYLQMQLNTGSTCNEKDIHNLEAPLGMATTRVLERGLAAAGLLQEASPPFTHPQSVDKAGVVFAVPVLIAQELLKCKEVYSELSAGYFGLRSTVLTLAFMLLCRTKNPEQFKQQKVGELGSQLGLDRIPETRCLRNEIWTGKSFRPSQIQAVHENSYDPKMEW